MISYLSHIAAALPRPLGYLATLLLLAATPAPADFRSTFFLPANVSTYALDSTGAIYLAGTTDTPNLMTTPGAFQSSFTRAICGPFIPPHFPIPLYCHHAFVARLDPTGAGVLALTYVTGELNDNLNAIAAGPDASVWLAGSTTSTTFPVTAGQESTAGAGFVAHVSADATRLLFARRLDNPVSGIAVDQAGNVYLTGSTPSGAADVWVVKMTAAGVIAWTRIFGGAADDYGSAIAIDPSGNILVAGITYSLDTFPLTPNAYHTLGDDADLFVTKLGPDGSSILYSSVFGSSGFDSVSALFADSSGNAALAGESHYASDFPTTPGALHRSAVGSIAALLSADGTRLIFGTYLDDGPDGYIDRAQFSPDGQLLVSGWTNNRAFATAIDGLNPCYPDTDPARYFLALSADGTRAGHATFLSRRPYAIAPSGRLFVEGASANVLDPVAPFTTVPAGPRCVVNAASFRGSMIAPGEIISVFGAGMNADTSRLLVDGLPAPLLYVSDQQINAVVPFGVRPGATVKVEVEQHGGKMPTAPDAAVVAAQPALFVGAVLNEDGSVNTQQNPAGPGSIVSLWGTGFGLMSPARQDGEITAPPLSFTALKGRVFFNGTEAEVLYAGDAPGFIAGAIQLNARLPPLQETGYVLVTLAAGDILSDYRAATRVWVR